MCVYIYNFFPLNFWENIIFMIGLWEFNWWLVMISQQFSCTLRGPGEGRPSDLQTVFRCDESFVNSPSNWCNIPFIDICLHTYCDFIVSYFGFWSQRWCRLGLFPYLSFQDCVKALGPGHCLAPVCSGCRAWGHLWGPPSTSEGMQKQTCSEALRGQIKVKKLVTSPAQQQSLPCGKAPYDSAWEHSPFISPVLSCLLITNTCNPKRRQFGNICWNHKGRRPLTGAAPLGDVCCGCSHFCALLSAPEAVPCHIVGHWGTLETTQVTPYRGLVTEHTVQPHSGNRVAAADKASPAASCRQSSKRQHWDILQSKTLNVYRRSDDILPSELRIYVSTWWCRDLGRTFRKGVAAGPWEWEGHGCLGLNAWRENICTDTF